MAPPSFSKRPRGARESSTPKEREGKRDVEERLKFEKDRNRSGRFVSSLDATERTPFRMPDDARKQKKCKAQSQIPAIVAIAYLRAGNRTGARVVDREQARPKANQRQQSLRSDKQMMIHNTSIMTATTAVPTSAGALRR